MLAYDPEAANLAILAEWEGAAEPEQVRVLYCEWCKGTVYLCASVTRGNH
jgi:hypothetical protein